MQRRRVRKAKGDAQYLRENSYHRGTWYLDGPVKIKKLRRVVTEGTYGRLWASERPCCEKECSACSGRWQTAMRIETARRASSPDAGRSKSRRQLVAADEPW